LPDERSLEFLHADFVADPLSQSQNSRPGHAANRPIQVANRVVVPIAERLVDFFEDGNATLLAHMGESAVGHRSGDDLGPTVLAASGLIPPGLPGHEPTSPPEPTTELPCPEGTVLRIAALPIYTGTYARLWLRVLAALEELGLRFEIVSDGPTAEVIRLAREGSVDLIAHRWVADYPDADTFVTSLVHSREGLLQGLIRSPAVDRLAEEGRRETDPGRRDAIYRQVEEQLHQEAVLLPLFHEQTYRFAQPWVEGLRLVIGTPEVAYDELRLGNR